MTFMRSLLIIAFAAFSLTLYSQVEESVKPGGQKKEKERPPFSQRLIFGGDIGLSFGTITYIKIAPIVGYRITDRLAAGLGPIYIYESYKNYNLESSTYGGKVVTSFTILKGRDGGGVFPLGNIVFHAENEVINVEPLYSDPYTLYYYFGDRVWIDNLLLGGGISQSMGGRFGISIYMLWDVTQHEFSPYSNPILKFGFYF
jgi:hypothetical protein